MPEGTEVGTAYVSILPSAQGFAAKLQSQITGEAAAAGTAAGKALGGGMTTAAAGMVKGVGGILAATGTWRFLQGSVREAEDAVRVGRLTAAVLKSTGGAAGVTAAQVEKLAGSLSKVAGVDDEVVQAGANVLLTFTRVRNQVGAGNAIFDRAAASALDMSAALGGDLQGSVLQLGKALNDPVAGMTALTRSGVSFTAQQKDQIKALAESGDLLAAQKIILGEVNQEFGGAAAANATATDRLGVAVGNFQESLGTAMLPAVNVTTAGLSGMLGVLTALPAPLQTATVAFGGLGAGALAIGFIAPKFAAAREELEGMGRAGAAASGALGVLGKVGTGIIIAGAVVEGANALSDAITRIAAGPVAPMNALTKGLVELGTTGKVTGELAKQLGGDIGQLTEKISEASTAGFLQTINLLNPSLQDSKRDIDSLDKALAGLVSSGHADVAAKALEALTGKVREGGGDALAAKFVGKMGDYREALNGVDVQALLTGTSLDTTGDAVGSLTDKVAEGKKAWDDLQGNLEDLVATDWSKQLASNFESALNPLERFTFRTGANIADLKTDLAGAQSGLNKANADLAKLTLTGTAGDIAKIRGQAGDIDGARAAVDQATARFNETKQKLAEAQKSPLTSLGENLKSNLGGLTTWLNNFNTVSKGHESLAKHLASLGPSSAAAMAEAVGVSPKQLDKLQALWDKADAKVAELASGQFELNAEAAGKPGQTLAEIITARYEKSLLPGFTQATLSALNKATASILGAEGKGLPGFGEEAGPGEARRPPALVQGVGPVAPPIVAPPAPPPASLISVPGFTLGQAAPQITIPFQVTTDANPREIAAEVGDAVAWRLAPRPTLVG